MSALKTFSRMLGIADHQAEDALHSERAAKAVLSRRSFFAASAALAAGSVFVAVPVQLARPEVLFIERNLSRLGYSVRGLGAAVAYASARARC